MPSIISGLPGDDDAPCEQRREPDHRRQVEDVRADDDAEARLPVALDQRDDRRGDLGRVGGDGGQEADRRLGQPDPRPDVVELVGEVPGGGEHDGGRDREDRKRERGRHDRAG